MHNGVLKPVRGYKHMATTKKPEPYQPVNFLAGQPFTPLPNNPYLCRSNNSYY